MNKNTPSLQLMTPDDMLAYPRFPASVRIAYGTGDLQFGDFFRPQGSGPFPLVMALHGGCWDAAISLAHLSAWCYALAQAGIACWSVEYRGISKTQGGWSGTFDDVVRAAAFLPRLTELEAIDVSKMLLVGHSAGGHLALCLASQITAASPASPSAACFPKAVLSLAGITDLSFEAPIGSCSALADKLVHGDGSYLENISPAHMPLPTIPVRLVTAEDDAVVPKAQALSYLRRAAPHISHIEFSGSGHFELITPTSLVWFSVLHEIRVLLGVI